MLRFLRLYFEFLGRYLRPLWPRMLMLALLLFGGTGLSVLSPLLIRQFLDISQEQGDLRSLYIAALLFSGVGFTVFALSPVTRYVGSDVAWRATNRLRSDLILHVLKLDMSFHNAHTPGELVERIDGDIQRLANFFSELIIVFIGGGVQALGVLTILWLEDWRIGLVMSAFAVIYLVVHTRVEGIAVPFWRIERQADADFFGFIGERLSGIQDTQTSGASDYVMRRYYDVKRTQFRAFLKARMFEQLGGGATELVSILGIGAALALGLFLFQAGEITIGTVYLFAHYVRLLREPLWRLSMEVEDLQRARVSIGRVSELFDTHSKVQEGPGAPIPLGKLEVGFRRVSFGYSPNRPVLKDISFTLRPGAILGVLGRTGSGKTTLTRLLFRLYDPTSGAIRFGGVDTNQSHLAELRSRIGMVSQDVQLFQASVRDNLTLFDPSIRDERIQEAFQALGLEVWFRTLSEGLNTQLLAGDSQLSAGEAQLLAFTRVFLKDPQVVVLDEASSRLDPATERLIEQAVRNLLNGRTGIVIAHRLATLQRVDEIMIIEDGRIQEYGPREKLAGDRTSRFYGLLRSGLEEVLK